MVNKAYAMKIAGKWLNCYQSTNTVSGEMKYQWQQKLEQLPVNISYTIRIYCFIEFYGKQNAQ